MAEKTESRVVGLKACRVGDPIATGANVEAIKSFTKIFQPYNGGITLNWSIPSETPFYDEGSDVPFFSLRDPSTGSKEITWTVANFDAATRAFYFGTTDSTFYEGEKAFAFDTLSKTTIIFARLKYVATLTGGINKSDPLQISVSATVLAPTTSGKAWDVVDTPEYTDSASL